MQKKILILIKTEKTNNLHMSIIKFNLLGIYIMSNLHIKPILYLFIINNFRQYLYIKAIYEIYLRNSTLNRHAMCIKYFFKYCKFC